MGAAGIWRSSPSMGCESKAGSAWRDSCCPRVSEVCDALRLGLGGARDMIKGLDIGAPGEPGRGLGAAAFLVSPQPGARGGVSAPNLAPGPSPPASPWLASSSVGSARPRAAGPDSRGASGARGELTGARLSMDTRRDKGSSESEGSAHAAGSLVLLCWEASEMLRLRRAGSPRARGGSFASGSPPLPSDAHSHGADASLASGAWLAAACATVITAMASARPDLCEKLAE
mmetsp:Transcript_28625/g.54771  ORF Transcript_28625/g.54771 Transcript_28625/m.54771 type:complete len:230 (-) Transcript_28625:80-769(-)